MAKGWWIHERNQITILCEEGNSDESGYAPIYTVARMSLSRINR
jgi:hypothetical protein